MTESVVLRRKAFRLPRHPASVGEARHRTGGHLASWGHPPRSAIREETVLLVSELAADTVLHGPRDEPDFEVAVTVLAHGSCLVEVSDGIPDEAVLPTPDPDRAAERLDRFRLAEAADRPSGTYAGGMRRRLDLAGARVARPAVVVLDEPTTGHHPPGRSDTWECVRELVATGTTVLLTT
ncbi:ATP-binding cassette domain-containing protein, partial [Streptomyces albidoflavus]|uniref:ATP-binding cassette domain-containing protein n=3 Tax=Streptomyces TaxID=1883 RepID=UPI00211C8425